MFAVDVRSARWALVPLAAMLAVAGAGCGGGASGGGTTPDPAAPNLAIRTSATLGNHLVTGDGRSLYYFALDTAAVGSQPPVSHCEGSCLPFWPVFHVDAPRLGTGLSASDFGEFVRADGAKQTTFKGWPLYSYVGDTRPGDTNGDDLGEPRPTDLWFVVKDPFYAALLLTKDGGPTKYLADAAGRALYVFARDTVGAAGADPVTACTVDPCLHNWPAFVAGPGSLPTGVDPARLTTFTRSDGTKQSALDGHPLYQFIGDTAPGDTKGHAALAAFDVANPDAL